MAMVSCLLCYMAHSGAIAAYAGKRASSDISWRYAREVEHSDDNLNALEDWLFEHYAPEGCVLEEE